MLAARAAIGSICEVKPEPSRNSLIRWVMYEEEGCGSGANVNEPSRIITVVCTPVSWLKYRSSKTKPVVEAGIISILSSKKAFLHHTIAGHIFSPRLTAVQV